MTLDYVLYDMSYVNLLMYSSVIPSYNSKGDDNKKDSSGKKINADDKKNNKEVLRILSGK